MPLRPTLRHLALALVATGVFAAEKTPFKISVQLDWVAEPEHGGLYQAQARGWFLAKP